MMAFGTVTVKCRCLSSKAKDEPPAFGPVPANIGLNVALAHISRCMRDRGKGAGARLQFTEQYAA